MAQIGVGAAEIEQEFNLAHDFTILAEGSDLHFEGPCVARLLIKLPIGLGDRRRPHQTVGIEVFKSFVSFALPDPFAHPGSVDAGIDDQMRDMNIFGTELARRALRDGA